MIHHFHGVVVRIIAANTGSHKPDLTLVHIVFLSEIDAWFRRRGRALCRSKSRSFGPALKSATQLGFHGGGIEVAAHLCLPVCLDNLVRGQIRLRLENRDDLVSRLASVQRLHQGLLDGRCSVEGATIGPGLEVVGFRNMPVAPL